MRAQDLLAGQTIDTASGDAGWSRIAPACRAVWATPIAGEEEAPERRIIHCRIVQCHGEARLDRLVLRRAQGYHKCGSHIEMDWVRAFRVLLWNGKGWDIHRIETEIPEPGTDKTLEFDLGGVRAPAVMVEVRQCGIDRWWPSWNLVAGALALDGVPMVGPPARKENRLRLEEFDLSPTPSGVAASRGDGEVRYRTRFLQVGFVLGRAGFSYLALDDEGRERIGRNILRSNPGVFLQGPRFHPVGAPPVIAPLLCNHVEGTTRVRGNIVEYDIRLDGAGQRFRLRFTVLEDRILLSAEQTGERPLHAWESNIWTIACHSEVSAASAVGRITKQSEAGLMTLPAFFHVPGQGSLAIHRIRGSGLLRSDSFRPLRYTTLELKVGDEPQPEGDYFIPEGIHRLEADLEVRQLSHALNDEAPEAVKQAVRRCALTSMSYRADTATLTNNGNSIHCPISMDNWSAVAIHLGNILPGFRALDLVRDSLERWLDEGPGYASGKMLRNGEIHFAEDEYLMTGTAALVGLGEFLAHEANAAWLDRYAPAIKRMIERMRARDLDDDGLVESPHRLGVSGQYHWSTNWFDVVSFGWKDAFANALLYRALVLLADALAISNHPELGLGLRAWAERLRNNFLPTFYNSQTGWLAGWRCKEGKLHDYAFLAVNGAACNSGVLPDDQGRIMIRRLYDECVRIGLPDSRLGLPGNLWPIPDDDLVEIMHGRSMGHYINGGLTHSQSRHFIGALYKAGLRDEADALLLGLCESLADGTAFGGCNSGVDWRYWDGWPSGYEGLLTDQFGILAVAMDRYR
ncbi:MAG: hypothetical protein H6Q30_649 [Bacteroidetes bacterium]|nr:hypothetical protein [Bacteroidota bacterium]